MFIVSFGSAERRLGSPEAVNQLLDVLHAQCEAQERQLVAVQRGDSGDSLSIGLGAGVSVLSFIRGDNEPPYYLSVGNGDHPGPMCFMFGGDLSEYPPHNLVSVASARAAITYFCQTGGMSADLNWEEV